MKTEELTLFQIL